MALCNEVLPLNFGNIIRRNFWKVINSVENPGALLILLNKYQENFK